MFITFHLLISFVIFCHANSSPESKNNDKCGPCGTWMEHKTSKGTRTLKPKLRIIGGTTVTTSRPWMAYIEISAEKTFQCGGTIINSRYVLSAAHCACDAFPCKLNKDDNMVIAYKSKGKFKIYVGFTELNAKGKNPESVYDVVDIKVHEKYRLDFHDLALFKVDRAIRFSSSVHPICLPTLDQPKGALDTNRTGYVAGWGYVKNQICHTGPHGPNPYTPCRFPFEWRGKVFNSCALNDDDLTPSDENPICHRIKVVQDELNADIGAETDEEKSIQVDVIDSKSRQRMTSCFPKRPASFGWCATCRLNVTDPSDPWICPDLIEAVKDGKVTAVKPSLDADWGICKPECSNKSTSMTTETLQEVKLNIFGPKDCSEILKRTKSPFNVDKEICAGKVNKRKVLKVYTDKDGSVVKTNDVISTFIGGQDSCLGDSGGPLWVVENSRAVLVGVVSRGLNCANNDAPGIYVRIKSYIEWIRYNTKDGNQCTVRSSANEE